MFHVLLLLGSCVWYPSGSLARCRCSGCYVTVPTAVSAAAAARLAPDAMPVVRLAVNEWGVKAASSC